MSNSPDQPEAQANHERILRRAGLAEQVSAAEQSQPTGEPGQADAEPSIPETLRPTQPNVSTHWFRRAWPWMAVFLLALGMRLVYLGQIRAVPFYDTPVSDAAAYDAWARQIAAGDWIGTEAFYQAPAYPYFLALVYRFIDDGPLGIRVVQAILGAVSCLFVGFAGARFFSRRVGITAAALFALYPPAIFFGGLIQKTALATLWMALLLWLASLQLDRRRGWVFLIMGVVLGLFGLTRENALVLAGVVLCWIFAGFRGTGWRMKRLWAAHLVAGLLIVFYPVALRNWFVAGEWVVTTVQAGPNFYIGNHPGASGRYAPLVRGHETPEYERSDARRLAEEATGHSLTDLGVSRYWFSQSWDFIRSQPANGLRLFCKKLALAINHYEITDTEGFNVYCVYSWWLLGGLAPLLHFGTVVPLAAAGLVLTLRNWRRLAVLYGMAVALLVSIAAFYVFARYRFPLAPLAILFAATGLVEIVRRARARQAGKLLAAALAVAATAAATNLQINPEGELNGMAFANLGAALAERGDINAATRFFEIAIRESPDSPEPYYNIGLAYLVQGNTPMAIENLLEAKRLAPDLAGVDYQLGVACETEGNLSAARDFYQQALELDPSNTEAATALARLQRRGSP